jgi:adenosylcobinamide kinase/adenosylcobinamide-phosphate guanylyltransferase
MLGGHDIDAKIGRLDEALDARKAPTITVANEVGLGIVPETALGRAFRDRAGTLNQHLAASATRVVLMVAGVPLTIKPSP